MARRVEAAVTPAAKYSPDGPFVEPVLRCDGCGKLVLLERLHAEGACLCGNRRVKNVATFDDAEWRMMKDWDVDPDFLALFEQRSENIERSKAGKGNVG